MLFEKNLFNNDQILYVCQLTKCLSSASIGAHQVVSNGAVKTKFVFGLPSLAIQLTTVRYLSISDYLGHQQVNVF